MIDDESQKTARQLRYVGAIKNVLDRKLLVVSLLVISIPFIAWGANIAWHSNENKVRDWLPEKLETAKEFTKFFQKFGSDELLMIGWEGCSLDDPRIEQFRQQLVQEVETDGGKKRYFRDALTGPQILEFYQSPPLSMQREDALKKMKGWILSADGNTTCLIAFVTIPEDVAQEGRVDRHAAIEHVRQTADRIEGLSRDAIFIAGPTIQGVAFDQVSQEFLLQLNLASFGICLVILLACLRSIRASLLVFLVAFYNEMMSMSLVTLRGENMDSVLLLAANLTFVLSISVGIHLVNYYREALQTHPDDTAPAWSCLVALKPTILATLTTAFGLASLMVSDLKPIYRFGFYSSISIIIAAMTTMILIGVHFSIWPLKKWKNAPQDAARHPFRVWTALLRSSRWPIVTIAVICLVLGLFGMKYLRTSVGLHQMISSRHRVIGDFNHLETLIGPLTPIEVVLEMEPGDARKMLAQFRTVSAVHDALALLDKSYTVISTQTFAPPPPPKKGGFRQRAKAVVFRKKLSQNQEELSSLGYLNFLPEHHYWRITIRCSSTESLDYGVILDRVKQTVEKELKNPASTKVSDIIVTGGVPVVYQAQQLMLTDLVNSFFLAFALVGCTLMVIFRNVFCGLICMIPNVLPCALAFGLMGYADVPIELGTILTVCAALGIAVDDSMHFITWFRQGVTSGMTIRESVYFSFRRCAFAMLQTTMICSFGLLVFALSLFLPISRFGWCMFTLLLLALVADLIVLPAILLTSLGRPFLPKGTTGKE